MRRVPAWDESDAEKPQTLADAPAHKGGMRPNPTREYQGVKPTQIHCLVSLDTLAP